MKLNIFFGTQNTFTEYMLQKHFFEAVRNGAYRQGGDPEKSPPVKTPEG